MHMILLLLFLSLSQRKKKSTSRKKSGYNIFVSWFYLDFKLLKEGEKETYLISSGVWAVPAFIVSDEDSTRTPSTYGPHHVMKATARLWHLLDGNVHEAWKKRAIRLNMVPLPGSFWRFPKEISKKSRTSGNKLLEELALIV
eukprot:70195-Ditylum_brightwellii.AAC.1